MKSYPLEVVTLSNRMDGIVGVVSKGHHDLVRFTCAGRRDGHSILLRQCEHIFCRVVPVWDGDQHEPTWFPANGSSPGAFPVTACWY